jgi:hypothetical protein
METCLKVLGVFALLMLGIGSATAEGQYPSHSIKIIVPPLPAPRLTFLPA